MSFIISLAHITTAFSDYLDNQLEDPERKKSGTLKSGCNVRCILSIVLLMAELNYKCNFNEPDLYGPELPR